MNAVKNDFCVQVHDAFCSAMLLRGKSQGDKNAKKDIDAWSNI